jgi:hypothetical protein
MGSAVSPVILEELRHAGINPERMAKKGSESNVSTQAEMLEYESTSWTAKNHSLVCNQ